MFVDLQTITNLKKIKTVKYTYNLRPRSHSFSLTVNTDSRNCIGLNRMLVHIFCTLLYDCICQSVPLKMMIMMITSILACGCRPLHRWCWWHRCCCCCWCSTLKRSGGIDWVPSDGKAGPSLLTRRGQRKHWTTSDQRRYR